MYEAYYSLSGKPFQLNPDPEFFYASRGHMRAMAYLEYGLHQSEGFIVITGEVGAGKTTLVRNLLQRLETQNVVAAHIASTQMDADDILRLVAAAFGLPGKDLRKSDLLLSLEMLLLSLTAQGKRALLIIDEAQNLPPKAIEELRMLSNFQLGHHALLQTFLVGQPEFRRTMQSPELKQLRQRVIASYHLGPMDPGETKAYIEHRLRHVGWSGNPRIEPSAYAAIFDATGGIPRRINILCDRLLLSASLGTRNAISAEDAKAVIVEIAEEVAHPAGAAADAPAAGALSGQLDPRRLARADQMLEGILAASGKLQISARAANEIHALSSDYDYQRLEARMATIEATLEKLLAIIVPDAPPAGDAVPTAPAAARSVGGSR